MSQPRVSDSPLVRRYLDWFVTTPLILLNLGMIAGADPVTILAICAGDMLMIFGGFMGSVSSGHIKWLWFCLSLLIFMPIVYVRPAAIPCTRHLCHPAALSRLPYLSQPSPRKPCRTPPPSIGQHSSTLHPLPPLVRSCETLRSAAHLHPPCRPSCERPELERPDSAVLADDRRCARLL